jgi:hypothetical protein
MTAAVALIAGYSQAVAVTWSSGAVLSPLTGAVIGTTTGSYLAQIFFYNDAGGTTPYAAGGTLTDTSSSATSALNATTGTGFAPGTYYAQMVITTTYPGKDTTQYTLTSSIRAFTVVSTVSNYNINMTTGTGLAGGGNSFPKGGDNYGWEPVPEPTSIALLVLGVTAIGLRRRLRKA